MNREARRTLCDDAWMIALIVVAILLGSCVGARASEPCPCADAAVTNDGCNTCSTCCGVTTCTLMWCGGSTGGWVTDDHPLAEAGDDVPGIEAPRTDADFPAPRTPTPLHSFGPPSPAAWTLTTGGPQRLGIVLSPATWERALDAVELLPAVAAERDAALKALDAERASSTALRDALASSRAEVASLRLSLEACHATTFRVERRSHRRGVEIGLSLFVGALAGAAVTR